MENNFKFYITTLVTILFFSVIKLNAQNSNTQSLTKDSLDGAFDFSDYIIQKNGFIPVPVIITESSLGGFGGGVVPVFINRNSPYVDTIMGKRVLTPVAPDITGAIALYTANDSWMLGAFRSGTIIKWRLKYMFALGKANINMAFYKSQPELGDIKFDCNLRSAPVLLQVTKRIAKSHWYAGGKYLFLKSDIKYVGDPIKRPTELIEPRDYKNKISQFGVIIELDNRDNIFTPDNGMKFHLDAQCSNEAIGSDYNYWRLNYYMYAYKKISPKLVGGLRVDGQVALNDAPFFMLPYIDMRGIPIYRYQGNQDLLTEVEARWDLVKRWSLMLYGGTGKAFNDWNEFKNIDLVYSYGTGFRYLMARKFKLRMGVDVAFSKDSWGYYIVFGSNWLK